MPVKPFFAMKETKIQWLRKRPELKKKSVYDVFELMVIAGLYSHQTSMIDAIAPLRKYIDEAYKIKTPA